MAPRWSKIEEQNLCKLREEQRAATDAEIAVALRASLVPAGSEGTGEPWLRSPEAVSTKYRDLLRITTSSGTTLNDAEQNEPASGSPAHHLTEFEATISCHEDTTDLSSIPEPLPDPYYESPSVSSPPDPDNSIANIALPPSTDATRREERLPSSHLESVDVDPATVLGSYLRTQQSPAHEVFNASTVLEAPRPFSKKVERASTWFEELVGESSSGGTAVNPFNHSIPSYSAPSRYMAPSQPACSLGHLPPYDGARERVWSYQGVKRRALISNGRHEFVNPGGFFVNPGSLFFNPAVSVMEDIELPYQSGVPATSRKRPQGPE